MSATSPDTGQQALNGAAVREVRTAAASVTASPSTGSAAPRRLGLALAVIATAQLMVVLDATIVNVALPHIQTALGFSGTNLEWVVNAYALAFGGLLLLGGRSGDLLGRRRVFIFGILLFSLASLLGGFATSQEWLLTARVLQGVGGAFAAPTALSLIAVTFPEGRPRNRAMGVYAGMSIAGGAVGLLASGLLLTYLNWRWVFFVNVPIGLAVALLAPRVLGESERQRGRFDLPGAITGSLGLAALVYGLSSAATTPNGVSHWGDTKVIVSLVAAAVLLVTFGIIEVRSRYALLPIRVLRSRDRSGGYLISLCIGTALFGMFFFLTLFVQNVLGLQPAADRRRLPADGRHDAGRDRGGLAAGEPDRCPAADDRRERGQRRRDVLAVPGHRAQPLRLRPARADAGDRGRHGAALRAAVAGLADQGGQQRHGRGLQPGQRRPAGRRRARAGGARHRGVERGREQHPLAGGAAAAAAKTAAAHLSAAQAAALQKAATNHALAHGFSEGYLVSAGIMLLGLVITLVLIRVKREDLSGINPMAAPTD